MKKMLTVLLGLTIINCSGTSDVAEEFHSVQGVYTIDEGTMALKKVLHVGFFVKYILQKAGKGRIK